jgi:uncharacterized protein (DUF2141 family)
MRPLLATAVLLLGLGVPLAGHTAGPAVGDITVTMSGFRNAKGTMRISLFASPQGFPGDHRRAVRTGQGAIRDGRATFTFLKVPHGTYAIAVLHDENGNGKMDTNFLGIPTEGGGASNDAPARFGPPKFAAAKFILRSARLALRIHIRYP